MAEHRFLDETLSFDERVRALLDELTLDEKLGLLTTHMNAVPRLGIKEFWIAPRSHADLSAATTKTARLPPLYSPSLSDLRLLSTLML